MAVKPFPSNEHTYIVDALIKIKTSFMSKLVISEDHRNDLCSFHFERRASGDARIDTSRLHVQTNLEIQLTDSIGGGKSGAYVFKCRSTVGGPDYSLKVYVDAFVHLGPDETTHHHMGEGTDAMIVRNDRPFREIYTQCRMSGKQGFLSLQKYGILQRADMEQLLRASTDKTILATVAATGYLDKFGPYALFMLTTWAPGMPLMKCDIGSPRNRHFLVGTVAQLFGVWQSASRVMSTQNFAHWDLHPDNIFVNFAREVRPSIPATVLTDALVELEGIMTTLVTDVLQIHTLQDILVGEILREISARVTEFEVVADTMQMLRNLQTLQAILWTKKDLARQVTQKVHEKVEPAFDTYVPSWTQESPRARKTLLYYVKLWSAKLVYKLLGRPNIYFPEVTLIDFDLVTSERFEQKNREHRAKQGSSHGLTERAIAWLIKWIPPKAAGTWMKYLASVRSVNAHPDMAHLMTYIFVLWTYYEHTDPLSLQVQAVSILRRFKVIARILDPKTQFQTLMTALSQTRSFSVDSIVKSQWKSLTTPSHSSPLGSHIYYLSGLASGVVRSLMMPTQRPPSSTMTWRDAIGRGQVRTAVKAASGFLLDGTDGGLLEMISSTLVGKLNPIEQNTLHAAVMQAWDKVATRFHATLNYYPNQDTVGATLLLMQHDTARAGILSMSDLHEILGLTNTTISAAAQTLVHLIDQGITQAEFQSVWANVVQTGYVISRSILSGMASFMPGDGILVGCVRTILQDLKNLGSVSFTLQPKAGVQMIVKVHEGKPSLLIATDLAIGLGDARATAGSEPPSTKSLFTFRTGNPGPSIFTLQRITTITIEQIPNGNWVVSFPETACSFNEEWIQTQLNRYGRGPLIVRDFMFRALASTLQSVVLPGLVFSEGYKTCSLRYEIVATRNACMDVINQSLSGQSPLVLDVLDCMSTFFLPSAMSHVVQNMDSKSHKALWTFLGRADLAVRAQKDDIKEDETFVSYDFATATAIYPQPSNEATGWIEKLGFINEVLGIFERRGVGGPEVVEKLHGAQSVVAFLTIAVENLSTPTGSQRFMKHVLEQAITIFRDQSGFDGVFVQMLAMRRDVVVSTQDHVEGVSHRVTEGANSLLSLTQMLPIVRSMTAEARKTLVQAIDSQLG